MHVKSRSIILCSVLSSAVNGSLNASSKAAIISRSVNGSGYGDYKNSAGFLDGFTQQPAQWFNVSAQYIATDPPGELATSQCRNSSHQAWCGACGQGIARICVATVLQPFPAAQLASVPHLCSEGQGKHCTPVTVLLLCSVWGEHATGLQPDPVEPKRIQTLHEWRIPAGTAGGNQVRGWYKYRPRHKYRVDLPQHHGRLFHTHLH